VREEPPPTQTAPQKRTTASRKRTLVGSLTPDGVPDRVFPLLDAEHTLGRAPENTITIADGSVSSRHARILRTPQGFVIEDQQSRNGTFVNGERVTEKRQLVDGDLIRVGKIILIFNIARESKTGDLTQPEVRLA
jgi:putative peptide zinc metalloprotease protein